MILSEDHLRRLLVQALEHVPVPAGCAAVLEGSIAEGFGNDSSDIDFLLIDDSEQSFPGTPTVLFLDGRRVEVRVRSTRDVEADRQRLVRLGRDGGRQVARIPEDLLNRCQRLRHAFPLRERPLVDSIQRALPERDLESIVSRFFAHRARQSARYAVALSALAQARAASDWAMTALTYGAKSWVAARGETYVESKWLASQLERVASDEWQLERLRSLRSPARARLDPEAYVTAVLDLLPALGVDGCGLEPERVSFQRSPGVTTWPIGGRLHVLRGRQDVLALGDEVAGLWRQVVFELPLPAIMGRVGLPPSVAGEAFAELHRLGLVRLRWRGGGTISVAPISTPAPSSERPILSLRGAVGDESRGAVTLVPIPAQRFAAAGMALTWANVMIENAREDSIGALAQEQWGLLEAVVRRMLRRSCLSVLSAYGVDPLPSQEDACECLRRLPGIAPALVDAAAELDAALLIDGAADGERALRSVDELVVRMRAITGATGFPSSFVDADGWRETLETFYDWVRLGAYLDSSFPLDDLRDVLLSVDRQQRATSAAPAAA